MTLSTNKTIANAAVPATFCRQDERGSFIEAINTGPWETVITGTMNEGAIIGNHYHKHTRMFFFALTGAAVVDIIDIETGARRSSSVNAQHGLYLEPGEAHAIRFETESTFLLLKSHPYDENDPDTFAYPVVEETTK